MLSNLSYLLAIWLTMENQRELLVLLHLPLPSVRPPPPTPSTRTKAQLSKHLTCNYSQRPRDHR